MNVDRAFELLSASADGDLTSAEQAELDNLLSESEEARKLQRELEGLDELLEGLADLDPPPGLRDEIMRKMPFQISQAEATPTRASWLSDWLPIQWGSILRYGVSTAFGALLVVAVYESRPDFGGTIDITELVGTMAPDAGGADRTVLDRFSFDTTGVSSIARLEQIDDALVLDVRIDTDQLVEVAIDFAATGLEFEALAQTTNHIDAIQFADHVLRVKGRGQRRFAVLLRKHDDTSFASEAKINLEYWRNGIFLQQGTLSSTR